MFESIKALNPRLNASIKDGAALVQDLLSRGISSNPRLYANQVGGDTVAGMVPWQSGQDNRDIPDWANANSTGSLQDMKVPEDEPIYLSVWVPESGLGEGNFCNVAETIRDVEQGLLTLRQAVGV